MNRGYVRLWRRSLDAGWIKNPKLWAFWCYCLMRATHKEYDAVVGLQTVHLKPGQLIFGRRRTASETGLTEREIRTILTFLTKSGNLTIKTTNKYSVITIVNWHIYQGGNEDNDQHTDQQVTSRRPHTNTESHKHKTYTVDFESFWKAYPKKTGKDAAFIAWKKRKADLPALDDLLAILDGHKKQASWNKDGGQYIPNPATWLNQGRWQDESEPVAATIPQRRGVVPISCSGCGKLYLSSDLKGGLCLNCRGARHEH
jgi:hypothetical protein